MSSTNLDRQWQAHCQGWHSTCARIALQTRAKLDTEMKGLEVPAIAGTFAGASEPPLAIEPLLVRPDTPRPMMALELPRFDDSPPEEKKELPVPVRDLHFMAPAPITIGRPQVQVMEEKKEKKADSSITPKNSPTEVAPEPTSGGLFSSLFRRGIKRVKPSPPTPKETVKSDSEEEYVKMSLGDFDEEKKH